MHDTNNLDIEHSNRNYDDYFKLMISIGHSYESASVMISNLCYSYTNFIQDDDKIGYNEILNGKYFNEKKDLENIIFKEEKKIMQIEYADKLSSAFQSVAFKSDKLVLNRKFVDKGIKLSDAYIMNCLKEKKHFEKYLEFIQPLAEMKIVVSSINEDFRLLYKLNSGFAISLHAYIELGILVTHIDSDIKRELIKAGLIEDDLIWLISYKQIMIELHCIYYFNYFTINFCELDTSLRFFVNAYIRKVVMNRFGVKSKKKKVIMDEKFLKRQLENMEDKMQRNQKLGIDLKDIEMQFSSVFNKYFSPDIFEIPNRSFSNFEQFMKFVFSRNFDSILIPIYIKHSYNLSSEKEESVKLKAFYKLYSLMMPHRKWDISSDYIQNEQQDITKKMRKFITKK